MYMIEDMIDMGLKQGQKWPSKLHRQVAIRIALLNSRVTKRDSLIEIVQAVIAIPKRELKLATYNDLANKYNVPFINLS